MKNILLIIIALVLLGGGFYYFTNRSADPVANTQETNETPSNTQDVTVEEGAYTVDEEASQLEWFGTRIVGRSHTGTVPFKTSSIVVIDGEVQGSIYFDIPNITSNNEDLTEHLLSGDFFEIENYPEAVFVIGSAQNGIISGQLTIKDNTESISIPVIVTETDSTVVLEGQTIIDRTDFGMTYESGTFFQALGDKAIRDDVDISFVLVLVKQ